MVSGLHDVAGKVPVPDSRWASQRPVQGYGAGPGPPGRGVGPDLRGAVVGCLHPPRASDPAPVGLNPAPSRRGREHALRLRLPAGSVDVLLLKALSWGSSDAYAAQLGFGARAGRALLLE